MIHTSPKTIRKFALDYDEHGDSFYDDTTVDQLKAVFNKIEKEVRLLCIILWKSFKKTHTNVYYFRNKKHRKSFDNLSLIFTHILFQLWIFAFVITLLVYFITNP